MRGCTCNGSKSYAQAPLKLGCGLSLLQILHVRARRAARRAKAAEQPYISKHLFKNKPPAGLKEALLRIKISKSSREKGAREQIQVW